MTFPLRRLALAAVLVLLALPPLVGAGPYALQVANLAFIAAIAALGLTIATGITGQIVLGQAALMGLGAYTAGLLMVGLAWPWWLALPAALLATGLAGTALGAVSVRIRGHYLAITTLALNEIFRLVVLNEDWLTGGPLGLRDVPVLSIPALGRTTSEQLYWPLLAVALLAYWLTLRLYRTRLGRDMRAVRDDDLAAESMGVNSRSVRTTAFVLCALWASLAGALYVMTFGFVSPNNFTVAESIRLLLMVVIGGLGSIGGTFLGALVVTVLPEALRGLQTYYMAVFGLGVVVILLVVPRGLGIVADWVLAPWLPGASGDRRDAVDGAAEAAADEARALAAAAALERRPVAAAARPDPAAPPLVSIEGVSKSFGGLAALTDVSFDIRQGEILGLIGPNGSGKSTLINAISGIVPISAGTIRLGAAEISGRPAWEVHAAGVSRIFQNVRLWDSMTVLENVMIPHPASRRTGTLTAAVGGPRLHAREAEGRAAAMAALELIGIAHLAERRAGALSFGQGRLVEIARAVVNRPKLLLLDEPGAGLRGGLILELAEILRRLRDEGMTVLMVEHRVKLVTSLCDRIVVLNLGETIAEGVPEAVARDPAVVEAYLGSRAETTLPERQEAPA